MMVPAVGLAGVLGGLLLLLGLGYAVVIGSYVLGFRRVLARDRRASFERNGHLPFVSVIVPARDEAACIEHGLRSILACDYPQDLYEIIVVDDLSRDETPAIVRSISAELAPALVPAGEVTTHDPVGDSPRVKLLSMPENLERSRAHKKRAITKGVEAATGEIILTTDADCIVPQGWIREMASRFEEGVALVSGPVLYPVEGRPARDIEALEFLGLVAVGAGAIGAGRPNLCNGANVAYRKDVFEELGGFSGIDHLTSGDDELLMQKIAYTTPWEIRFCTDPDAAVETEGPATPGAFIQQRRRWASKGQHYQHAPLRAIIGGIYSFYVLLLMGGIAAVAGLLAPWVLLAAAVLKVVPEALLLWPACRHFGRERLMAYFLSIQPLHVLYIITIGAAGAAGGYTWKERRIER